MGDLTKNISRHEGACKCGCGFDTIDFELATVVQELADDIRSSGLEVRIDITGPNRCLKHNDKIKLERDQNYKAGSSKSKHMTGKAWDIKVFIKWTQDEEWIQARAGGIYDRLNRKYPDKYGIGNYKTFTHIDVRKTKARW